MIEFTERPCLEYCITNDATEETSALIEWCDNHAIGGHNHQDEFYFWIPPLDGHKKYIKQVYGDEIPQVIENILLAAVQKQAEKPDQGTLFIVFV
jgi:hypothetical protein